MARRILTIIGARPQFVKATMVSLALSECVGVEEILLHTGQHFDADMSDIFFDQLGLRAPDIRLDINRSSHGRMTGRMLEEIEGAILMVSPDMVLVYGDTNSTLAGALAAAKLNVPVAHVEAGLRSFDWTMPEEVNRVVTDRLSTVLFCPTDRATTNLEAEGLGRGRVVKSGDVMEDAVQRFRNYAIRPSKLGRVSSFALATIHRSENTDNRETLKCIVQGLNALHIRCPVVLPLHPRTRTALAEHGLVLNVHVIGPVGYLEMLWLLKHCDLVITDSGGVQKEAYFNGKQCITLRRNTEWTELLDIGANVLVGSDPEVLIIEAAARFGQPAPHRSALFGGGHAAAAIVKSLKEELNDL